MGRTEPNPGTTSVSEVGRLGSAIPSGKWQDAQIGRLVGPFRRSHEDAGALHPEQVDRLAGDPADGPRRLTGHEDPGGRLLSEDQPLQHPVLFLFKAGE